MYLLARNACYCTNWFATFLCISCYLRPRSCPPLGRACGVVTDPPHIRAIISAVFAVDRPACAVVERLHALHHPGLVAELPAGLTAGTPVFHHPPVSAAGIKSAFFFFYHCITIAAFGCLYLKVAYLGWLHSCTLQRLRMGLGFLLVSQKLRCTKWLSLFLLHPYLVYCIPVGYNKYMMSLPTCMYITYSMYINQKLRKCVFTLGRIFNFIFNPLY